MYLQPPPDPRYFSKPPVHSLSLGWALELQQRNVDRSRFPNYAGLWGDSVGLTTEWGVRQAQAQTSPFSVPYRGPINYVPKNDAPRVAVTPENACELTLLHPHRNPFACCSRYKKQNVVKGLQNFY